MSFFDDDPFDSIVREFFGENNKRAQRKESFIKGEEDERVIDFIENSDNAYLIIELPGFSEEDIKVVLEGRTLQIKAQKKELDNIKDYLAKKLARGEIYTRSIPQKIEAK